MEMERLNGNKTKTAKSPILKAFTMTHRKSSNWPFDQQSFSADAFFPAALTKEMLQLVFLAVAQILITSSYNIPIGVQIIKWNRACAQISHQFCFDVWCPIVELTKTSFKLTTRWEYTLARIQMKFSKLCTVCENVNLVFGYFVRSGSIAVFHTNEKCQFSMRSHTCETTN